MQMFSTKTREWFLSSVGTPTEAQRMGWQAISEGRDALISSPTGSGKTLAAFLYFLDEMRRELDAGALAEGLRIVYVSPLKALGNDIRQNLERPLAGLGLSDAVRVAVRTGDTDAKARREMIKHPPHILITTPESLYLLLTSLSGRDMLKTARTVIVDELHAVLSSKRGAHLFLSLARLDALCGGHVRRVGLSATVNPPEEAARHLTGGEPCAVIVPKIEKRTELTVDVPVPDMRQLPERSVWPAIADRVIEALDHARTVLVFVDGRAGCERLALRINERAGQTLARTHHGCVSKEQRLEAERMLKSGELRVMVATSSMELGVDVGEIDLVVQVGPPPGVSALLQRLGRAGHNPGRVSRMRVYPRTAAEAIGCALVCEAAREGRIERVRAPEMCLDVLSQHLVSMAAAGAYTVDEAVEILSRAYAYRRLASEDVKAVLGMLSGDYERMDDRPVKPRVVYDRLSGRVSGDAYTRMLALSAGGTIPDRGWFAVTLPDGTRLGELDEEFVFEARLGDKFYLGAFPWKIEEITRDRVIVSPTSPEGAASPFWKGDRAARAYETGAFYGSLLSKWEDAARRSPAALRAALCAAGLTPDAAENAARVLESQLRAVGCLATDRVLVAEHFSDEAGEHQLMLHSPFGDAVNRALGMLLARRAAAATGADARAYDDDDGALICLVGGQPIPDALLPTLAATSAPDAYPVPLTPNTVSNTSSCDASGAQLAFDNPVAAPGMRITSINPDTTPGASCASANPNTTSGAHFTSINPDTTPGANCASASTNAAPDTCFTSTNPDTAPSVSCASASASAAPGMRITSINPDTKPGVNCASTNPNAASGAQLALDNPAAAPGAQLASADPNAALGSRLASVTPDATSVPLCGAAAEVRAMLPASPMFSMAFRYNVQRALLNGVRGGRRQPLWVQRLRGAEALGAAAAHPEHPMMRETLNECADGYLDLNALTRLLSAIRAGQVRVYEAHTDAPSPLCLNLRRQVEAEMMYDTAIPSAAVTLSKEALLTLAPTEEAVKSASRPARAPRSADELHARLLSEGDLLAEEADAPAEWMDALEIAGRAVYIEPGLWIARENEDEYRLALEENDGAALSRVVRRAARFHGAQTAETLSERYAVDEARAQEALNALRSEGILREFGGAYVHAELYESAQRMTVALSRQRVETQPARAFARMLSQRVRGAGSSAAQLAQALDSLRGCAYPAAAWEGYLLPARVANYRPQLLDEALARGEAAYRVLPAERSQLPGETRAQAAARTRDAAPSDARVSIDGSQLPGEAAVRDEAAECLQLPGETRAQAADHPRSAASRNARVSIDGSRLLGKTVVRDEAAERPRLPGETRAQAAARTRGAAPSGARISIDGSRLPGEAAERPQLSNETRAQATARTRDAAPSGARVSIDGSQLPGEAAERSQLSGETRAQATARPRSAAPSGARISVDGSRLPGETAFRDEAAERPQLSGEPRAQAAARPRGAAPSSARVSIDGSQLSGETRAQAAARPCGSAPSGARVSIDGSQLPGEATERDGATERSQLPGETRAQAAARPCGAAPSGARVSIDGSQLPGEAAVRDEAAYRVLPAERSQLPNETRAQAAARPCGAAPSGARVSIDGSRLLSEAAERPQLPGETRAQATARPCGAAPSGARISIDGSQLPGEATERDGTTERSQLPGETRAQAAARARDAAPSDAHVSIDGSQLPGEAAVRDEAAYRVLPAERPQLPGETAVRVLSGERSQLSGETAGRVQSGEMTDSRSIPAPEIDGVPADPLAASRARGSVASAFELHAQRRGTAVLDQGGSAHPESGLRDGRAIFGERTRVSRAASGERVRVQFDLPDDEGEYEPLPDDLTDMERDVLQTLTARGASFASRLPVNAGDALKLLLARGLVRADSFLPVREMLATESGNVKKTVRRRVRVMDAGRWSRVGALPQTSAEALVERLFDRFGIVCRETAGADWNAAFGVLKHMEYAGKARRGYFVKGLSGAQFVRETDYSTITAQLRQPSSESLRLPADSAPTQDAYLSRENNLISPHGSNDDADLSRTQDAHLPRKDNLASSRGSTHDAAPAQLRQSSAECVWLPAADPMQAWGAYLAHEDGRAFLRVPGTAVALMDGAVVAVAEKQGETLRVFDDPAAAEALRALADTFRRGAIFPALPRLLIKKYPPTAAAHLEAAGFTREMLDYTLMRRG